MVRCKRGREEKEKEEKEEAPKDFLLVLFIAKVGDVPVLFSDKFQQSNVLLVPLIQFIYDFWTFLLCSRDRCVVRWCRKLRLSRGCSPSKVVDIPFVPQKLIPTVQTIQQIMEIPHLLFVFGGRCPCCAGRANSQVLP